MNECSVQYFTKYFFDVYIQFNTKQSCHYRYMTSKNIKMYIRQPTLIENSDSIQGFK